MQQNVLRSIIAFLCILQKSFGGIHKRVGANKLYQSTWGEEMRVGREIHKIGGNKHGLGAMGWLTGFVSPFSSLSVLDLLADCP